MRDVLGIKWTPREICVEYPNCPKQFGNYCQFVDVN